MRSLCSPWFDDQGIWLSHHARQSALSVIQFSRNRISRMARIDDLEAFVAIVEKRGQTAAAQHLRRSPQSISRPLAAVEQDLRVELVRRTTRQSEPTEAGHAFYRRVKPALAEINDARLEATN